MPRQCTGIEIALRRICSTPELVGLGFCSKEIEGVSRAALFRSMMNKIDMPQRFLPVSSVSVRPAMGDAGDDGALWRSMRFEGPGALHGSLIVEHIYANPAAGMIRFVTLNADGSEGDLEVINALLTAPIRIEYYQRRRLGLERVHWAAPLSSASHAIATTVALARAQEAQQLDPSFVAAKA
eukprot:CAMPEP_0174763362 /NCGR_PEP_ID=MMETSP1094-20130205/110242_1 /TAXON_ID=156173 /ORGANISM="Chrysochromulina brevifilum, Strain UTEX LB 985" /LENGTH=181 /DNA_ID=CAMNT_0015969319 /DNA_START=1 /DNA_END=546 /DNA_ORIENTATION=-